MMNLIILLISIILAIIWTFKSFREDQENLIVYEPKTIVLELIVTFVFILCVLYALYFTLYILQSMFMYLIT